MAKAKPPKGGRKGGAIFPRVPLEGAVKYARKLVSKTQISALPASTIYPGVFGVTGTMGQVRVSALRRNTAC
jgi:hypothetical protein